MCNILVRPHDMFYIYRWLGSALVFAEHEKNETFLIPSIGSHWSAFFLFPFCFWRCWTRVHTHSIRIIPYRFLFQSSHLFDKVSNHACKNNRTWPKSVIYENEMVTSMLVTDVGDQICWWQVWDVSSRFRMLATDLINWENHQHNEKSRQHNSSATNISN